MSNGLVSILAICAGLMIVGTCAGWSDRRNFAPRWLLAAAALVLVNDVALTRAYGLLPSFGGRWNWTGKLLALAITLALAALPAFGWKRSGLTLKQRPGSLRPALVVSGVVMAIFTLLALTSDRAQATPETVAFQLTMPGLEEEPFFRGILLLALNEALRGRFRALGIEWSWGALLSSALFGVAHAFGYSGGAFSFDLPTFVMTGAPSLILMWMRERTGSLLLPVALHNFGNSIGLFI